MLYYCPRCGGKGNPVMDNDGRRLIYPISFADGNPKPVEFPFHIFNCKKCDKRFGVENADLPG